MAAVASTITDDAVKPTKSGKAVEATRAARDGVVGAEHIVGVVGVGVGVFMLASATFFGRVASTWLVPRSKHVFRVYLF